MFESLESRTLLSVSLSGGTLTITGTPGKDNIVVAKKSRTVVQVTGAGPTKTYTTATFSGYRLSINGGDGDDTITINGNVSYKSAKIFGGKGKDHLQGGAKVDEINGEADNDFMSGGDGADRLLGGDGNDTAQINVGDVRNTPNGPIPFNDGDAYDMGAGRFDTIKIQGTDRRDRIFLEHTPEGLEVNGTGESEITVKHNELIEINALGGNDRIRVQHSAADFGHINLDGGAGTDTFVGDFEDLNGTKTPVNIEFTIEPN